ncbi:MAG: ThuA domain-containing protein [Pirellulales bacterium]|nr:ThuA domain-containing protein [Pirellulales bacterium]
MKYIPQNLRQALLTAVAISAAAFPARCEAALLPGGGVAEDAKPKRLLIVAEGPDSHPPGTHEYVAEQKLLAQSLANVPGLEVTTSFADNQWAAGPDLIDKSEGVVLVLAEGGKWMNADPRRKAALLRLAERGGGIVGLHGSIATKKADNIEIALKLLGACHGGPDRKYAVFTANVALAAKDHPITAGMKNFRVRDEFYYRLKRDPQIAGFTPLLTVAVAGKPETVGWCWRRPDGGRSFGFSGGHFFDLWRRPEYQRLFTQGILWTLNMTVAADRFCLENDRLAVSWRIVDGRLMPDEIFNKFSAQKLSQAGAAPFRITLEDEKGDPRIVAAADLESVEPPRYADLEAKPNAVRAGDRATGRALNAAFRDPKSGATIHWRAVLRDGADYVRASVAIAGGDAAARLRNVELLDVRGPGAAQVGSVPGSPVAIGQTFFGVESPFTVNQVSADGFRSSFGCNLPLGKSKAYTFSSVVGAVAAGQLRRGFLRYLERERAVPYHPFLHYNCWYDLVKNINERDVLAAIAAFSREMTAKRGAAIDSYVLDDGWDDPKLGFWAVSKSKFPRGFAPLSDVLEKEHSRLGIWISPLGGYAERKQRTNEARKLGLVRGESLDLSDPKYYAWFRDDCADLMRKNRVNYFKWDEAGAGVSPHFMALLNCADELRQIDPQLFLNVTVGTWPSPFWLHFIDSTWRGGHDQDFIGKGDEREKSLTYRDGQTYRGVVQRGPLYPLNSLMTGGIIHAKGLPSAVRSATAGNDLRREARSFFGLGTNLQELYIQHDMMDAAAWDAVAAAANWAKKNADALVDTHWVGGDPNALQPYGFASWSPRKAVLTLRNPDDQPREIALDAAVVFELPQGAPRKYALGAPYEDQRIKTLALEAGKTATVELEPFEVLVFDASPLP